MRRKVVAGITLLGIAAVADLIWVKTRSHAPMGISAAAGLAGAAAAPAPFTPEPGSGSGSCGDHASRPPATPSTSYALTRNSATCK